MAVIVNAFKKMGGAIEKADPIDAMKDAIQDLFNRTPFKEIADLPNIVTGLGPLISGYINTAKDSISKGVQDVGEDIKDGFQKEIGGLANQITNAFIEFGNKIADLGEQIGKEIQNVGNQIASVGNAINTVIDQINKIISDITMLIRCTIAFFNFISSLFSYISKCIVWFFIYFLPWIGQYFECIFQKIVSLPKCFFWYILDCTGQIMYLPFRILFWLIDSLFNFGIEALVNIYLWETLEEIDKYIHDDSGLGSKIHIIHFPDTVTDKCYNCHIKPIKRKVPSTCDLNKKYHRLVTCRGGNGVKKCNVDLSQYVDPENPTNIPEISQ